METKICKHCQTEIPKKAKVCPNCRKKQGGFGKWIIIGVVALIVIGSMAGGEEDAKKVGEIDNEKNEQEIEKGETVNNVFNVGDVVETDKLKISYISANEYISDNEFLQPKEGYKYWEFRFAFKNISDSDQTVSSMLNWNCYADNTNVDQTWIGDNNGLDATLSPGRNTEGTIYYEIPENAQKIELEYEVNFLSESKIIFIGK